VNLTTITLSPHTGTHADAPWHCDSRGAHPADLSLEPYIGPAHVVTIERQHGGITPADLEGRDLSGLQRLLIHTWVRDLPERQLPKYFPYPRVMLLVWRAERGAVLMGVDMTPLDSFHSTKVNLYRRQQWHGIAKLE